MSNGRVGIASAFGLSISRVSPPPPTIKDIREKVKITLADVVAMHRQGRDKAIAYWSKRFINEEAVDKYLLGYVEKPRACSLPSGYTIPDLSIDANGIQWVRGVDIRRDDNYLRDYLYQIPTLELVAMRRDLYNDWKAKIEVGHMDPACLHEPTDQELDRMGVGEVQRNRLVATRRLGR